MAMKYGGVVPIQALDYVAPGVVELSIDMTGTEFTFTAGQYIRITLPELETEGLPEKATYREFSLSNNPENPVATTVFRTGESRFKQTIATKRPGDTIAIDGPFGVFTAPEDPSIPQIYIAGGIGITPFMSLIRSQTSRQLKRPISLIYFYHDEQTAPYLSELRKLPKSQLGLYEYQGPVTAEKLWASDINPLAALYIAGPQPMVRLVQQLLTDAGISPAQIRTEGFTGYAE